MDALIRIADRQSGEGRFDRREFLTGSVAGAGVFLLGLAGCSHAAETEAAAPAAAEPAGPPKEVKLVEFTDAGERKGLVTVPKLVKSREEWKRQLTPVAFEVTRTGGTEIAFTGKYNKFYEPGIYRCICCNNALYSSKAKYDSGTGWPSFWEPIAKENVIEREDSSYAMVRTEVLCKKCDAHIGHVFPDGPRPTGLRYCMNSVALNFSPAAGAAKG